MSMMDDDTEQLEGRGRGSEMTEQMTARESNGGGSGSSMREADELETTDNAAPFGSSDSEELPDDIQILVNRHHKREILAKQCGSTLVQEISAPVGVVWPIVARFDEPQKYKQFVQKCAMLVSDERQGRIREVTYISGMPSKNSIERLKNIDENLHVTSFEVIGGENRFQNYMSVTSVHEWPVNDRRGLLVLESFVVDVPDRNTSDETLVLLKKIVGTNLKYLMKVAEDEVKTIDLNPDIKDSTDEANT